MNDLLTDDNLVWYLMRGTGVVLLVLLTLSTVLGVLATARMGSRRWPRFATQALHRNVSLLSVALLAAHAVTAVVHGFVDIRWVDALVPFIGPYEPLWVGLGTLALDAVVLVVVTSLLRDRLDHRRWRLLHLLSYLAWAASVVHAIGIGTDATSTVWGLGVTVGCVAAVVVSVVVRLVTLAGERRHEGTYAA